MVDLVVAAYHDPRARSKLKSAPPVWRFKSPHHLGLMLRMRYFMLPAALLASSLGPLLISEQATADADAAICESATRAEAIAACI